MNAVLDIIIICVIIFCVAMGFKNGFVKTVMNFFSFIIAFFIAKTFSPFLRDYMYSNWIKTSFADKAAAKIDSILGNASLSHMVQDPDRPNEFTGLFKDYGVNLDTGVPKWISSAAEKGETAVSEVAKGLVENVAQGISYFLAFIVIFIVALVLLKIAAMLLNKAVKLPGLNVINKTGGIVLGLLYGIIISYIFVLLAYYVLPYLAANNAINSAEAVMEDTIFFKWLYNNSPINYIMNLN